MTTLSFFLFTPAICHSENDASDATKPYLRFEGTNAPGGNYGLGWGLPKHPDIWANVCEFEGRHPAGQELNDDERKRADEVFQSVDAVAEDVENYIVDLRAGKIINKLDCPRIFGTRSDRQLYPDYFSAAGIRPNRHDLEVVWSQAGNLVLVNHTYRWDCVTFCALLIRDGKVTSSLDLNEKLGAAARAFAAKSFPRGSGYSKNNLSVSFSKLKRLSETKFSAHVETVMEKEWSDKESVVTFSVIPSNERTALKAADIRILRTTD
jgi:hypothetical protein